MNQLTGRDKDILKSLLSYGLLSSKQIKDLHFSGVDKRTVLRRLRKLTKAKWILRHVTSRGGEIIWTLSLKGANYLLSDFSLKRINRSSLIHDLIANDLRITLEGNKLGNHWRSSHNLRHGMSKAKNPYVREPHSIPDWLVEMKIGGRKSIVAMEVELNYKGKRRMQKVFDMYARKESINHIWYIVPTKSFGEKILRSAISLIKSHGKYKVFFSIISEVKDDPYNLKFYFSNEEVITQKLNVENAHSTTHCVSKTEVAA